MKLTRTHQGSTILLLGDPRQLQFHLIIIRVLHVLKARIRLVVLPLLGHFILTTWWHVVIISVAGRPQVLSHVPPGDPSRMVSQH